VWTLWLCHNRSCGAPVVARPWLAQNAVAPTERQCSRGLLTVSEGPLSLGSHAESGTLQNPRAPQRTMLQAAERTGKFIQVPKAQAALRCVMDVRVRHLCKRCARRRFVLYRYLRTQWVTQHPVHGRAHTPSKTHEPRLQNRPAACCMWPSPAPPTTAVRLAAGCSALGALGRRARHGHVLHGLAAGRLPGRRPRGRLLLLLVLHALLHLHPKPSCCSQARHRAEPAFDVIPHLVCRTQHPHNLWK